MAGGAGAQDAPGVFGDHEGGPRDACLAGNTVSQEWVTAEWTRSPRGHRRTTNRCPVPLFARGVTFD